MIIRLKAKNKEDIFVDVFHVWHTTMSVRIIEIHCKYKNEIKIDVKER